jgi:hypothetical protein
MHDEWGRAKPKQRSSSASSRNRGASRALDWLTVLESPGTLPSTAALILPKRNHDALSDHRLQHREIILRSDDQHADLDSDVMPTSSHSRPRAPIDATDEHLTVNALKLEINALRADVAERQWACARVLELGNALDVITEQNASLTAEVVALRRQLEEMEMLRRAQHVLIAAVDAGGINSNRLLQLMSTSESLQASCSELQDACRAVAKWGPSSCPSCLAAKEEKHRAELALKEASSRQSIQATWESLFATQRYCTMQYTEVESERMWQEDMYSHYATLQQLQRECTRALGEARLVPLLQDEVLYWKEKAALQSRQHAAQMESLRGEYDEKLRDWKRSFLRSDGNTNMLRWLLVSGLKSFHAHGKLLFSAAIQRKHLILMRSEVTQLGDQLVAHLRQLEVFCQQSLQRIAPQEWTSVPSEPSKGHKGDGPQSAHPPVLSAYARNAVVVQRSGSSKRSSSAPKNKPFLA